MHLGVKLDAEPLVLDFGRLSHRPNRQAIVLAYA